MATNAGYNPQEAQLPRWAVPLGGWPEETDATGTVLLVDKRERPRRYLSPLQGLFPIEIAENAGANINRATEQRQAFVPHDGYQFNLFYVLTMRTFKLVLLITADCSRGVPCAAWDDQFGTMVRHDAFQPFEFPLMTHNSPTVVDVKVRWGTRLAFHWVFRAFRQEGDLTIERQFVDDALVEMLDPEQDTFVVIVTVFQGWRISCVSFSAGGRVYMAASHGSVVVGDFMRVHQEFRRVTKSSPDAFGSDADRLEFRFRDSVNHIEVACKTTAAPAEWILISHITGQTLVNAVTGARSSGGRVEGPDQAMNYAQLNSLHERWFQGSISMRQADRKVVAESLDVGSHALNVHLVVDSQLCPMPFQGVDSLALAFAVHDEVQHEQLAVLPPFGGQGPVVAPGVEGPSGFSAVRAQAAFLMDDGEDRPDVLRPQEDQPPASSEAQPPPEAPSSSERRVPRNTFRPDPPLPAPPVGPDGQPPAPMWMYADGVARSKPPPPARPTLQARVEVHRLAQEEATRDPWAFYRRAGQPSGAMVAQATSTVTVQELLADVFPNPAAAPEGPVLQAATSPATAQEDPADELPMAGPAVSLAPAAAPDPAPDGEEPEAHQ